MRSRAPWGGHSAKHQVGAADFAFGCMQHDCDLVALLCETPQPTMLLTAGTLLLGWRHVSVPLGFTLLSAVVVSTGWSATGQRATCSTPTLSPNPTASQCGSPPPPPPPLLSFLLHVGSPCLVGNAVPWSGHRAALLPCEHAGGIC